MLNFYLKDNKNVIVLYGLRIEYNGENVQIDHMLITRFGIELIESKSLGKCRTFIKAKILNE